MSMKKLREELWLRDPHCYYCGIVTIPPERFGHVTGKDVPKNMATLDHKYHIGHPLRNEGISRYEKMSKEEKYVVSCTECNRMKGSVENSVYSLEELKEGAIRKLTIIEKMINFEKYDTSQPEDTPRVLFPSEGFFQQLEAICGQ